MFKVYIADDEHIVRQGLKKIINWQELGFEICGEASDGETALKDIIEMKPDLILIDIRMPKLQGLDLAHKLRQEYFSGRMIVLSGYSEFKYAQEAILYHVDYYLTKPIDEDELKQAVTSIYALLKENQQQVKHLNYYQEKAKLKILEDIIKKDYKLIDTFDYTLEELDLDADLYQVLILNNMKNELDCYRNFCRELKIPTNSKMIEIIQEEESEIILLKGEKIINMFDVYKDKHFNDEDKLFVISVGNVVNNVKDIYRSYQEALVVKERTFFSRKKQFIYLKINLSSHQGFPEIINVKNSTEMGRALYEFIIVYKQKECERLLNELLERLTQSHNEVNTIKNFLSGMLIYIIQEYKKDYASYHLEFKTNADIIDTIHCKSYLYDIIIFIQEEVIRMIKQISDFSNEGILEEIINFIEHHYAEDIKLKNIAHKFGYNSSYLGKIFSKKYGVNFNDYLHQVRIEKAKTLLHSEKYKVYEVSIMVGYTNVDYFHLRFKQFVGCTPNEYRVTITES